MYVVQKPEKAAVRTHASKQNRDRALRQGRAAESDRTTRSHSQDTRIRLGQEGFEFLSRDFNACLTALDILDHVSYVPQTHPAAFKLKWLNSESRGAAESVLRILLDGDGDFPGRGTLRYAFSL